MKNTGITRPVDALGRVVIPKEIRNIRDINENDLMEIFIDVDMICIRKVPEKKCFICGTAEQLMEIEGLYICRRCGCRVVDKFMEE